MSPASEPDRTAGSPGDPGPRSSSRDGLAGPGREAPRPADDGEDAVLGVREFQRRIEAIYLERDAGRGVLGTFAWFVEEVGELSRAIRRGKRENLEEEFGDCFAWLTSLASIEGVDLAKAARKYARGCPRCQATPCSCPHPTKPAKG